MPRFRYVAFATDGSREVGVTDNGTEQQAWEKLTSLGLTVVELVPATSLDAHLLRKHWFTFDKVPTAVQAEIAEQLAVLFDAHLRTKDIVDIIARGASSPPVRRTFERVGKLLAEGESLENAFEQSASGFSPVFVALVRLGQSTMSPAATMRNLSTFLRKQDETRAQIEGALVYPLILLLGGLAVLLLVVLYLAPALEPMFSSLGKEVPPAIGLFLTMGNALRNFGIHLAALVLSGLALAIALLRRKRTSISTILALMPVLGPIAREASLARLVRALSLMLESGVPLAAALRQTGEVMSKDLFAASFVEAADAVEAGERASSVLAAVPNAPVMFRELFEIGERANNLKTITASIAGVLEEGTKRKTQRAVQLITPLMTLFMGGGLAILVYAIMDAILSVNDLAF